jgi:branched-subunit amino acid aminotransferase/4-amino-4-deoxychorismate lyase
VTLVRIMALAETLVAEGKLSKVANRDIPKAGLLDSAAELFITSTSFDVLGVSAWDGQPVGDGRPGPVTRALTRLIDSEIRTEGPRSVRLA